MAVHPSKQRLKKKAAQEERTLKVREPRIELQRKMCLKVHRHMEGEALKKKTMQHRNNASRYLSHRRNAFLILQQQPATHLCRSGDIQPHLHRAQPATFSIIASPEQQTLLNPCSLHLDEKRPASRILTTDPHSSAAMASIEKNFSFHAHDTDLSGVGEDACLVASECEVAMAVLPLSR